MKKAGTVNVIKKNRMFLFGIILLIVLLVTLAGVFILQFYVGRFAPEEDYKLYDKYYVMITEDRNSEFWRSVYKGAYEEGLKNGVYVEMLGDNLSGNYTKEELMSIAIAEEVDGIILDADESQEMTDLINEASDKNIPVITAYHGNTAGKRLSFVGAGSYNMGRVYGKQVLQLAEKVKRQKLATSKNSICNVAILVTAYADQTWQNVLCSGIQETVNQDKYEGKNIKISLLPINNTTKYSAEESIREIFMEDELPDIIVCLNEVNTSCVYQAIVDYNKVGDVGVLAYYDQDTTLTAVGRGVFDATISIDTKQIGYYCTKALQEYYLHDNVSEYFAVDVFLINSNNVSEFREGDTNEDKKD